MPGNRKSMQPMRLIGQNPFIIKACHTNRSTKKLGWISISTLHNHIKGEYSGYNTSFGPEETLSADEETTSSLINFITYIASRGLRFNRKNLDILILEILKLHPLHPQFLQGSIKEIN